MQGSYMVTETRLLMHLRTEFFRLGMDFKKKSQACLIKNYHTG